MYKLVAIDIDGTLLNSQGELTDRTAEVIRKVTNKNINVVLTSGRVSNSVKNIANLLNTSDYLICDNGASIYSLSSGQTIWSREIDKETVLSIVDTCIQNNIYYMVFTDTEIIVKDLRHMALAFYKQRHHLYVEYSGVTEFRYAGLDYIAKLDKPIRRIVVCDEDRVIYESIVNRLKSFPNVSLMSSPFISNKILQEGDKKIVLSYSYAELLPMETNKWVALEELLHRLQIKPNEVMAIGDNFNDIQMIQNAGLGVAMNNGATVAKEVARVVAPSNNEDGVAIILERYILSKGAL